MSSKENTEYSQEIIDEYISTLSAIEIIVMKIAEEDLKIRGSGDTLGAKQSGLPNFKLANLDVHQKLLELARNLSVETVKNDPSLKSPLGKAQKTLLHLFKNEVAIDYIKSG